MHSFPQFTASTSDVLHKTLRPFEEQVCVINGTFDRFILLPITLSLKRFCHFMNYFIRMNLNMAPITLMIIRVTGNKICASSSMFQVAGHPHSIFTVGFGKICKAKRDTELQFYGHIFGHAPYADEDAFMVRVLFTPRFGCH